MYWYVYWFCVEMRLCVCVGWNMSEYKFCLGQEWGKYNVCVGKKLYKNDYVY